MVAPAEKTPDFIHIVEKFDHLEHLKLITFLMKSSHLATNRATAFFRDAIPLQQTKHYTTETKMQNFFKSSQTTNSVLQHKCLPMLQNLEFILVLKQKICFTTALPQMKMHVHSQYC